MQVARERTFILDDGNIQVRLIRRPIQETRRTYWSKTRVFGAIDALAPEENEELERWIYPPVTAQLKRDNPDEAERIMKGYRKARRQTTKVAKQKLNELLEELVDTEEIGWVGARGGDEVELDLEVQGFSERAGCNSCPCSPGFILNVTVDTHMGAGVLAPVDIYVEKLN